MADCAMNAMMMTRVRKTARRRRRRGRRRGEG
jgi:hypothetical protein